MEKKRQKGSEKGRKKGDSAQGIHSSPFSHPFSCAPFFFSFPPELHVGSRFFFRFFTIFVLLIEKGKKNRAKNEENGKKGKKGREKGREEVNNPIPKYRKYRFTRS
jgi:hypothetical protein